MMMPKVPTPFELINFDTSENIELKLIQKKNIN